MVVNGEKEETVEFNLFGEDFNLIGKSTTTFLAVPGKIIYHRIFFDKKDNNDTRSWDKLTENKLYPVFPNPFNTTTNILTFQDSGNTAESEYGWPPFQNERNLSTCCSCSL